MDLAWVEEGENWKDEYYRRSRDREWLPGWVLPLEWMDEDPVERGTGVPDIGQLLVT